MTSPAAAKLNLHAIDHAVATAPAGTAPFRHAVHTPFFAPEDYARLLALWPDSDQMTPLEAFEADRYPARRTLSLDEGTLSSLTKDQRDAWGAVSRHLCGTGFTKTALSRFQKVVAPRFREQKNLRLQTACRLYQDTTSYALGPHTDIESKVLTILVYMPENDALSDHGTALYEPKRDVGPLAHDSHHDRADFELVTSIPFRPNTMLMFARTDDSFHGVEPYDEIQPRRLLTYNAFLTEAD